MDINDSRTCNLLSLETVAKYYDRPYEELKGYYEELSSDKEFLRLLNERMDATRDKYSKGLFLRKDLNSVDWFGNQRVALYVLVRMLKPSFCLETGVFYGGTTAFLLRALEKNNKGKLVSIDLSGNYLDKQGVQRHQNVGASEIIPSGLTCGFIIPEKLKKRWELIPGSSVEEIPKLKDEFSFFAHDSEHSHDYLSRELELVKAKMTKDGTIIVDDVDWSNAFIEFSVRHCLYPTFLTDNGKDGLRIRLGLVRFNHPFQYRKDVVGGRIDKEICHG